MKGDLPSVASITFNRTIVELKYNMICQFVKSRYTFNRTIVELKLYA